MLEKLFACPTRLIHAVTDHWRTNGECSHCGATHPDMVEDMLSRGAPVKMNTETGEAHILDDGGAWRPVAAQHLSADLKQQFLQAVAKYRKLTGEDDEAGTAVQAVGADTQAPGAAVSPGDGAGTAQPAAPAVQGTDAAPQDAGAANAPAPGAAPAAE